MTKDITKYNFINQLKSLNFIDEIWLFGSRARGDNTDRSDIDLAIICPNATDKDWIKVTDVIEGADTLLKIDCVRFDKDRLSHEFYNNILNDKRVIYVKNIDSKDYFYILEDAICHLLDTTNEKDLDKKNYIRDATILRFEYTIELFWKSLKKILAYEKIDSTSPRDTLSKAYQYKLIDNEQLWLSMLDDANNTSHLYNENEANVIYERIKTYSPILNQTYNNLKLKYNLLILPS